MPKIKKYWSLWLLLLIFVPLFASLLNNHMVEPKIDGSWYSAGNTWGDLALHLAILSNFRERGLITIFDNPIYAGEKLGYPFLPDLISGLLSKIIPINLSLIFPTFIALTIVLVFFWLLAQALTKNHKAAFLAPLLFFFNGSLVGAYYFWQDSLQFNDLIFSLTHMGKEYAHLADINLRFSNVIADYILPQRTFIFGLALGLPALYFLWQYWTTKKQKNLFRFFLLLTFLPLVHTHTFLALGFISFFLFLEDLILTKNHQATIFNWLKSAVPLILVLPQFLLVAKPSMSGFLQLHPGWMAETENILLFWLKNLGAFLPLLIVAVFFSTSVQKTFFLPFLILFLVTNIWQFQPHIYDNMKLMLWPFLVACLLVAQFLTRLPLVFAVILALSITLSGLLSVYRETYLSWPIFSPEDLKLSQFIQANSNPNALFLTSDKHNNPVNCLAGRPVFLGFRGWLWTHGVNYHDREAKFLQIYQGGPETLNLITTEKINYVLLEKYKYQELNINESFFRSHFPLVYESPDFLLFKT